MVREIDAGPVWVESSVPISPDVDALYLRKLLIEEGIKTFPQAWNSFIDTEKKGIIPDLSIGKNWPKRKPEDGRIKPGMTIRQVKDMIRALPKPWPAPTIKVNGLWKSIKDVSLLPVSGGVPYETEGLIIYLVLFDCATLNQTIIDRH
jgi:methionyl-tRNA formyltransferase